MPIFDLSFWLITLAGAIVLVVLYLYAPEFLRIAILTGIIIYLGFGLPRWIGRKTRNERALSAKLKERETWGFCSRDREGPWMNYIDYPLMKKTHYAEGKNFCSEWLIIHDGKIIINPGVAKVNLEGKTVEYDYSQRRAYAWDGCTPKRHFFWVALIGTPDWWQKKETILTISDSHKIVSKGVFWQKTLYASLVHDALYQYLDSIPISKKNVDKLFYEMLCDSGVSRPLAKIYHLAVRFFGASDAEEDNPQENSKLKVRYVPE
jgi:hypothetical protein